MPTELDFNKFKTILSNKKLFSFFNKIFKKDFFAQQPNQQRTSLNKSSIIPYLKTLFMPPVNNQDIFGLDIGTSSIKLVQVAQTKTGLELSNLWIEELPMASEPERHKEIIDGALKKIISTNNIQGRIVSSIGGDTVNIQTLRIPVMPEEEIAKALEWEAQDELSIDLASMVMDYVVLGETDKSGNRQFEVLLVTVPKAVVYELSQTISGLGVTPYAFEPPPLAVVEAFGKNELKLEGNVLGLLELGAGLTNLSIIVDGMLRFTRNIPITSNGLTEDISSYFNIDKASAERLKIKYGLSGILDSASIGIDNKDESLRVSQAINFKLEKLVSNIDHTFKFYLHQLSNLSVSNFDKLILSGGGALLNDLDKFLSSRLGVEVTVANPFKKILINEYKFDRKYLEKSAPRFSLPIGLALRKDGF